MGSEMIEGYRDYYFYLSGSSAWRSCSSPLSNKTKTKTKQRNIFHHPASSSAPRPERRLRRQASEALCTRTVFGERKVKEEESQIVVDQLNYVCRWSSSSRLGVLLRKERPRNQERSPSPQGLSQHGQVTLFSDRQFFFFWDQTLFLLRISLSSIWFWS